MNKKSSDLSDFLKNNENFGMDNSENVPKLPTHMDVFNKLNSFNSITFNDNRVSGNIEQNNFMNFNPFQPFRNNSFYDDKKSSQYIPTPIAEKKISFPMIRPSESFDLPKGSNFYDTQLSQGGFKRIASFTSI